MALPPNAPKGSPALLAVWTLILAANDLPPPLKAMTVRLWGRSVSLRTGWGSRAMFVRLWGRSVSLRTGWGLPCEIIQKAKDSRPRRAHQYPRSHEHGCKAVYG